MCHWHEFSHVKDSSASVLWEGKVFYEWGSENGKGSLESMCKHWRCVQKMSTIALLNSCHPVFATWRCSFRGRNLFYADELNLPPCSAVRKNLSSLFNCNKLAELPGCCSLFIGERIPPDPNFFVCLCLSFLHSAAVARSLCFPFTSPTVYKAFRHVALRSLITYNPNSSHLKPSLGPCSVRTVTPPVTAVRFPSSCDMLCKMDGNSESVLYVAWNCVGGTKDYERLVTWVLKEIC